MCSQSNFPTARLGRDLVKFLSNGSRTAGPSMLGSSYWPCISLSSRMALFVREGWRALISWLRKGGVEKWHLAVENIPTLVTFIVHCFLLSFTFTTFGLVSSLDDFGARVE